MKNFLWFLTLCVIAFHGIAILSLANVTRDAVQSAPSLAQQIGTAAQDLKAAVSQAKDVANQFAQIENSIPDKAKDSGKAIVKGAQDGIEDAAKQQLRLDTQAKQAKDAANAVVDGAKGAANGVGRAADDAAKKLEKAANGTGKAVSKTANDAAKKGGEVVKGVGNMLGIH